MYFSLLTEEEATKLAGLDAHAKMVYRVIEGSGNRGIWTVDVRSQTNIPRRGIWQRFLRLVVDCCSLMCAFVASRFPRV